MEKFQIVSDCPLCGEHSLHNLNDGELKTQQCLNCGFVTSERYKGKILSRGGRIETIEGIKSPRTVLIEFTSMEDALNCYNSKEYQDAMKIGKGEFDRHIQIVEGI